LGNVQALALAKIQSPQNREELVFSLSDWKRVVYNTPSHIGSPAPRRTTLALQREISEAITFNLKGNRQEDVFGRKSPSSSPGYSEITLSGSPNPVRKLRSGNHPLLGRNSPKQTVPSNSLSEENSSMFESSLSFEGVTESSPGSDVPQSNQRAGESGNILLTRKDAVRARFTRERIMTGVSKCARSTPASDQLL
jgi:hypothetical protein